MLRAVIFDMDGLLADSEWPDYVCWQELFREHGGDLRIEEWIGEVGVWGAATVKARFIALRGTEEGMEALMRRAVRGAEDSSDAGELWKQALTGVARRLESAWTSLEDAARAEEAVWREDVDQVRNWKRPRLPLWLITIAIAAVLMWAGLVLGGFLPAPEWFRPVTDRVWGIS